MPFRNCADPQQLAILTQALDSFCERRAIATTQQREDLAFLVFDLYSRGATTLEQLTAGLDRITKTADTSGHDHHA